MAVGDCEANAVSMMDASGRVDSVALADDVENDSAVDDGGMDAVSCAGM